MAGDTDPDPLEEIRAALKQLQGGYDELRDAVSKSETSDARGDIQDAEEDLVDAARKAGLRPEQYRKAIDAARRQQFVDEHGDSIRSLIDAAIDERLAASSNDDDDDPEGDDDGGKGKPAKPAARAGKPAKPAPADGPAADPPAPDPDDPPVHEHWSERGIGGLIGR